MQDFPFQNISFFNSKSNSSYFTTSKIYTPINLDKLGLNSFLFDVYGKRTLHSSTFVSKRKNKNVKIRLSSFKPA